jgi:SAM-dependent methyltransferase
METNLAFDYSGNELATLAVAVNYQRWILSRFEPYLGDTVAEVGAGIGSFSKLLMQSAARKLYAFEPSQNMFPGLVHAIGQDDRVEPINNVFDEKLLPQGVDSVLYVNVLEHVEHDAEELRTAFRALRPGGHVIVFSPALSWLYSDFDRQVGHYRRYTKKSLVKLATDAKYRIVKANYFDVAGILPWYVSFVLLKSHPNQASVALYDKLVVPPMRVLERLAPPPIGKNVLLIAAK